jgi:hypothetical protein
MRVLILQKIGTRNKVNAETVFYPELDKLSCIVTVPLCGAANYRVKLHSLSTMRSEYIALSAATHDLLPLWQIIHDIDAHSFISKGNPTSVDNIQTPILPPSNVFEDNNACIVLATTKMHFKPRMKHISI